MMPRHFCYPSSYPIQTFLLALGNKLGNSTGNKMRRDGEKIWTAVQMLFEDSNRQRYA